MSELPSLIDLTGWNKCQVTIKWNRNVWPSIRTEVENQVIKETDKVLSDIANATKGPKSGRIYKKSDGREHQASAPGEPWATDTGNALTRTITRNENSLFEIRGTVSLDFDYALALELGNEKIEPRPTAVPALENRRTKIIRNIKDSVRRGAAKAGTP